MEDGEENADVSKFDPTDLLTQKVNDVIENVNFGIPPDEDYLTHNSIWPETHKFYGHGYDIFSVACSHDGKILNK